MVSGSAKKELLNRVSQGKYNVNLSGFKGVNIMK